MSDLFIKITSLDILFSKIKSILDSYLSLEDKAELILGKNYKGKIDIILEESGIPSLILEGSSEFEKAQDYVEKVNACLYLLKEKSLSNFDHDFISWWKAEMPDNKQPNPTEFKIWEAGKKAVAQELLKMLNRY